MKFDKTQMVEEQFNLYESNKLFGTKSEIPCITIYKPYVKTSDGAILCFAGGAYYGRCDHEGVGYAQFFRSLGVTAFVVNYRCAPAHFPDQLLDARLAVRFVRAKAEEFGINKNKITVIGSSAGGNLCSLLSTYRGELENESKTPHIEEDYLPNAQILCYPVISTDKDITHEGSYRNLLGNLFEEREKFSAEKIADERTPKAFIWHTAEDELVNVINSYEYAKKLRLLNVPCELHVFPFGRHGLGLANDAPHVAQWKQLMINWLRLNELI